MRNCHFDGIELTHPMRQRRLVFFFFQKFFIDVSTFIVYPLRGDWLGD